MRSPRWLVVATFALVVATASVASAGNALYVDDDGMDGFNCAGAPYTTINDALADAEPGDDIRVCPGTYPEQIVITKNINLRGEAFGTRRAVIRPPAVPNTLPALEGSNPVTGAVLIDADLVRISDIDVDLADVTIAACSPVLTGIYYRNTNGSVDRINVRNVWVPLRPDCPSGVAFFVESGPVNFVLGSPVYGRSRVTVKDVKLENYQKGGFVAAGPKTVVLLQRATAIGGAAVPGATVPNGIQFSQLARGKITDSRSEGNLTPSAPTQMGTGVLLWKQGKVTLRRDHIVGNQVGIFVVGDNGRIKRSFVGDQVWDGIVLLGDSNLVAATEINGASVSGCFVNGDQNVIRGSYVNDTSIGLWFIAGIGNLFFGTTFGDVPLQTRGVFGGVRPLTVDTASPFQTRCTGTLSCDDGNACSQDVCDLISGTCSHPPVDCNDNNTCTTEVCDPAIGCVYTVLPDATVCTDGSVCTTGDACAVGVCVGALTPAATTCNAGNGNVCDGAEQCNPLTAACDPGTAIVCNDNNECTTDSCDPILGCQAANVPDTTPCTGGTCTTGVCS